MSKRDQIIAHYEKKIAEYEKRLTTADALAEAAANHIADFPNPLMLLDLIKVLREYREASK